MSKLIWIGPRESDMEYTGHFFAGAVTLYGNGGSNASFCKTKNYRINHNNITLEQTNYMVENELKLIEDDPSVEFMSYNPNLTYGCNQEVIRHTVCLNEERLMCFLDSKISFRKFAQPLVHILESVLIKGRDCTVANLKEKFPGSGSWIIQSDIASGGYKTFLLNEENQSQILVNLQKDEIYLVSTYYENNIPINIHAIIYERDILLTPGSIQVMGLDRGRLLYRGADFIEYRNIDEKIKRQFNKDVAILCKEIQSLGYRGVIGIDAMIVDGTALILEVNNRFQASTILVNKSLAEAGMPSLHVLNYEAFHQGESTCIQAAALSELKVNYSMYTFIDEEQKYHAKNINSAYQQEKFVTAYIGDGYSAIQPVENEAYLFRLIFNTNIVSIAEQSYVRVHPNIETPDADWYNDIVKKQDFRKTKISLLNQGVVLEDSAKRYLEKKGGMRPGVYFAVDLTLDEKYIVNAPLYVKFAALSPYHIKYQNEKLTLFYYGNSICTVKISFADKIAERTTSTGISVSKICLLATDRLRIQNSDFCTFKENHIPCRFCEVKYKNDSFSIDDILEAVSYYMEDKTVDFRHVLIGGLSNHVGQERHNICEIIKCIRKYSDMPIYLMCLPCVNIEDIDEYVRLGVTEIGFNIEIFDRKLAACYMPGKGKIPLERYQKALKRAVELLGNKGAVRSAFVVGLESMDTLLDGVEYVCKMGVAPIFSVFRPIPYTEFEDVNPPSNRWLLDAYMKAENICKRYGLSLGPDCPACQNNTLSFDELIH